MSSEFFQLDLNKAKGLYKVKKDKTSIDKFGLYIVYNG